MILNKNIRCISYIYGPGNHQAKEIKTSYSIITRLEEREIKITKISPITSRITYSGFSLCCLYFLLFLNVYQYYTIFLMTDTLSSLYIVRNLSCLNQQVFTALHLQELRGTRAM